VYKRNIEVKGENGFFDFDSVRQLIPSITAKMNFQGLEISKVKKYYLELV
jgi:hypothetical protein